IRTACASRRPSPSTRTLEFCAPCVIATLEITEAVAAGPAGSCVWASGGSGVKSTLARIRQPFRRAGQFVIIAVLLLWSKFFYSHCARLAYRTRLYLLHGTSRHPWKSFPPHRHKADHPRAENKCAIVDY